MFNRKRQVTELTTTDGKGEGKLKINGCLLPYTIIGQEGQLYIIQVDKCLFPNLASTPHGDRKSTEKYDEVKFLKPQFFLYNMEEGTIVPYSIN